VTRTLTGLTVLALVAVGGVTAFSAGSSSASLSIGVTVARSCVVDARPADTTSPPIRLTCAPGAQSNVKFSEPVRTAASTASSADRQVVTLNF
jgi:hypothetical protein